VQNRTAWAEPMTLSREEIEGPPRRSVELVLESASPMRGQNQGGTGECRRVESLLPRGWCGADEIDAGLHPLPQPTPDPLANLVIGRSEREQVVANDESIAQRGEFSN
jgi:hypothetical protein